MIREVLEKSSSHKSLVCVDVGNRREWCYVLRIWWDDMEDIVELKSKEGLRWQIALNEITGVELEVN